MWAAGSHDHHSHQDDQDDVWWWPTCMTALTVNEVSEERRVSFSIFKPAYLFNQTIIITKLMLIVIMIMVCSGLMMKWGRTKGIIPEVNTRPVLARIGVGCPGVHEPAIRHQHDIWSYVIIIVWDDHPMWAAPAYLNLPSISMMNCSMISDLML